jgi:hypothetical protein
MSLQHTFKSLFAAGLCAAACGAQAHLAGTVTIDFQGMPTAVYGEANTELVGAGQCAGAFTGANCYFEDDFIIGVVSDPVGEGEHVHRTGSTSNRKLSYHADSSGIYVRAEDGHEFGLFSLDFDARLSDDSNPDAGPDDVWEILGFKTAVNPDLSSGNGTDYATRVAYQTVANGFNGVLTLDHAFHDINAFWIHFKGYPGVPDGSKDFLLVIDNIVLGPAEPAPVPVPAVGLWMLVSGVAGIAALGRRRQTAA